MTQTLDTLLQELQQKHGDGWVDKAVYRYVYLVEMKFANREEELQLLNDWILSMVAAGVAATEQPAASSWEPSV